MDKHIQILAFAMLCVVVALCASCKKNNTEPSNGGSSQTVATVTTNELSDITRTTAVCGGEVVSENGWAVTQRGVCWNTVEHPTLSDSYTVDGEGIGRFTSKLAGLEPGATYYVRAYAKNAAGTSFGPEKKFITVGGSSNTTATLTTDEVTDITRMTALCGGEVTSENGSAVTKRGVCWSAIEHPTLSDSYTVDGEGIGNFTSKLIGLKPGTIYYVRAYAENAAGIGFGPEKCFTTLPSGSGVGTHDYVDLGLPSGTLWATCNVGAENPEDHGDYFAWGETSAKNYYEWTTYQWCSDSTLTKYVTESAYGASPDYKIVLELADDAAHVSWGGDWRMPTYDEMVELWRNCTWEWISRDDRNGYLATGPNGNSIFLPAAGSRICDTYSNVNSYGYYWSNSLGAESMYFASRFLFCIDHMDMQEFHRAHGCPVRPVCSSQKLIR